MKLNLLPATVSRGRQSKTAWIASVIIILAGVGISLAMTLSSAKAREDAKADYEASIGPAQKAYATSQKADAIMGAAGVANLTKNVALAQAMISHNDRYPDFYNDLIRYIPPFFRVTSIAAAPAGENQASVTLVGTLASYQQYADLMLALMRNKEAVSVARSGFQSEDPYVPQLTEIDQSGTPHKPGETPIPDDPLQRLAFFQANAPQTGVYTGEGNFGSDQPVTRYAMKGESLVTVQLIVNHDLTVPNPRATIGGGGGGASPIGGGGGAPAAGGGKAGGAPAPAAGGGGGAERNSER